MTRESTFCERKSIHRVLLRATPFVVLASLLIAGPAAAKDVELFPYTSSFNGSDAVGVSAATPEFKAGTGTGRYTGMAINQMTGEVYVAFEDGAGGSGGYIYKFDSAGVSQPFSDPGIHPNTVIPIKLFGTSAGDLAIDNSGGSTEGRIYLHQGFDGTTALLPSGAKLNNPNFPIVPSGQSSHFCGMTVAPNGNIWAKKYQDPTFTEFAPTGEATGKVIALKKAMQGCTVVLDALGNVYATTDGDGYGPVVKYSAAGVFLKNIDPGPATVIGIDRADGSLYVAVGTFSSTVETINRYDASGKLLGTLGRAEGPYQGLGHILSIAVNEQTHEVYVISLREGEQPAVDVFDASGLVNVPSVTTSAPDIEPTGATLKGVINPDGEDTTDCQFEWGSGKSYPNTAECQSGKVLAADSGQNSVAAAIAGLTKGATYHVRLASRNSNGWWSRGEEVVFKAAAKPVIREDSVSDVNTDGVRFHVRVDPEGGDTRYRFEWGTEAGVYPNTVPAAEEGLSSNLAEQSFNHAITGLGAGATYHYRVVAKNGAGTTIGPDRQFTTFAPNPGIDPCPNAHVRQQTEAALLLDCRAYELVSAPNTGGYDVESDLLPGQVPLISSPAAGDRLLYSVHRGAIPGIEGSPTNFGRDPYVATRGPDGWTTEYVGLPADGMADEGAFGSPLLGTDSGLSSFAFGGVDVCDPCFADGSTNVPLRLSDGSFVKGMAGSLSPAADPVGELRRPFSDDGNHFIFGATSKFEAAGNNGSVSIYDRHLKAGTTQVVSTLPNGSTMSGGVSQLDVSEDGSRIVVATTLSTDAAGNEHVHPYLHLGSSPNSVDLAPGTTTGVLFAGMSTDGSKILYTSEDKLLDDDTDASTDLYEAVVGTGGSLTLKLLSTGAPDPVGNSDACDPHANEDGSNWNAVGIVSANGCGVVAIAGGGGVARDDGSAYFFSPEKLDGSGTLNEPNLFAVSPGEVPHFVATVEPNNSAIRNAVTDSEVHRYADFQVTPDGQVAVFSSKLALTGFNTLGHVEIYRYDTQFDQLACPSCAPTGAAPASDTGLAPYGLNLSDDGRVFFTSSEPLVLRDTNQKKDAYQWSGGTVQIVSTGNSPFDSGLLSVSSDGTNAFFFTRQTLVAGDQNGALVKIYSARASGGFPDDPPPFPCAASDECHGPGTQVADPPSINTASGAGQPRVKSKAKPCKRSFVKRRGKCVKRPKKGRPRKKHPSTTRRPG
jgi:hypothetical protein